MRWLSWVLALLLVGGCHSRREGDDEGGDGDVDADGDGDGDRDGRDAGGGRDAAAGDPDAGGGRDAAPDGRPVGAACSADGECADGWCLDLPGGYCSRRDCDANDCPAGSTCSYLVRDEGSIYACLANCDEPSDCRVGAGYWCGDGYWTCYLGGPPEDPDGGVPEGCNDPWSTDCPLHQACDLDTHECVTACSQDQPCHEGCCDRGQCVAGDALDACGAEGWRCYDCGADCDSGAGCDVEAGICECDTCTPSGAFCNVDFNDCCSGFCAGLNGDTHCG